MRSKTLLRVSLAALLGGGTMTTIGCGDLVGQSIRNGLFNYVAGRVSSGVDAALLGDFITDVFTGGLGGGEGSSAGGEERTFP